MNASWSKASPTARSRLTQTATSFRRCRRSPQTSALMAEARHQHRPHLHGAAPSDLLDWRPRTACASWSGCRGRSTSRFSTIAQLRRHDPPRDRRRGARARATIRRRCCFALGNEIPPGVVRWHGQLRVERFLREPLRGRARRASPDSLFTYVNFPPTEFLDLSFFDVCAFNVYLHREPELRAYLARLQHIAGHKPLLLAEAGADSIREGEAGQAEITAMHIRAAFEEGACGAMAFAWTDEWWRGGHRCRGLGVRARRSRAPPEAGGRRRRGGVRRRAVLRARRAATWPRVSVVVCAYNAADTLDDCLASLEQLTYPDYEIILVNDGSRDRTGEIARRHARVPRHRHPERRPERRAQRRPRRSDRRDRRLHRRRHARRSATG